MPTPLLDFLTAARLWPMLRAGLRSMRPAPLAINGRERLRVVLGAGLGLLAVALLSHALPAWPGLPWLVAPLGASAVLVFGLPSSPLAQPWAVVGGNSLSALMAAAGMLYNPLTGRRYPHAQDSAAKPPATAPGERAPGFSDADLDAVLARYNQVLDIPRDDLRGLLEQSEIEAHRRRIDTLRCRDIMSADPLSVAFGTPLQEAWQLLRGHRVKALPVVDRYGHIVGIVTQADFLRGAELDHPEGLGRLDERLRRFLRATPGSESDKPEVVGQIMSRHVRVASADRPLNELVPLFSSTGHHHIPIIGERNRLVGIITQTDLVAALARPGGG